MYDIDFKNIKKGRKFGFIFLFVGIFFFILMGIFMFGPMIKKSSFEGEVVADRIEINSYVDDEGSTMYSPTYYYTVDGVSYVCSSGMSSSIKPSEKENLVWYDVNNPSDCVSEYDGGFNLIFVLFMLIPILSIYSGYREIKKVNDRIKIVKHLNECGKLVKGIPYQLEHSGISVNNRSVMCPVFNFLMPDGTYKKFVGDPFHNFKERDEDGLVDMIYDEANPDLYYIALEINRYTGNSINDYYRENGVVIEASVSESELNQGNFDFPNNTL